MQRDHAKGNKTGFDDAQDMLEQRSLMRTPHGGGNRACKRFMPQPWLVRPEFLQGTGPSS